MTPELKAALENLLAFPDLPFQDVSPPLACYHTSRQEKHAKEFIKLAARFVMALKKEKALGKLRERAAPFGHSTGPGSRYQELREEAYRRLSSSFKQPSADGMAERLSVAQLRGQPTSSRFADVWVTRADVEKYLGDPDAVLRFPSETFTYCEWLVEFLSYFCPEIVRLGYEIRGIREQVEETHLWGYFLLASAYDAVRSTPRDAGPHRTLVKTIVVSPETMAATKAAAKELAELAPVEVRTGGYISLSEAAEMVSIRPQNAQRKAKKNDLLKYIGDHPLIERRGWCVLHKIDPDKPVRPKRRTAKPKVGHRRVGKPETVPEEDAAAEDAVDAAYDKMDAEIRNSFRKHPGEHLSVKQIHSMIRKNLPDAAEESIFRFLKVGAATGSYKEDDKGNWF